MSVTDVDREKARNIHECVLARTPYHLPKCESCAFIAQALAEARADPIWQLRVDAAEARVKELEASMVGHFQRDHLEGDGPEIDRWKRRVLELTRVLADVSSQNHYDAGHAGDNDTCQDMDCAQALAALGSGPNPVEGESGTGAGRERSGR